MLQTLFSVLAPHNCLVCNREGYLLCRECSDFSLPPVSPRCAGCMKPSAGFKICDNCKPRLGVRRVWPATSYGDVAKRLVKELKFSFARAASKDIARLMASRLPALPSDVIIVPVPTATVRVRQRGFDHAKLIAKEFARLRGLAYWDCMGRHGKTRQVGAKRDQRSVQLAEAFWLKSKPPQGSRIFLVDDVCTTGASIGAAARAFDAAGYERLYAAVFALTE